MEVLLKNATPRTLNATLLPYVLENMLKKHYCVKFEINIYISQTKAVSPNIHTDFSLWNRAENYQFFLSAEFGNILYMFCTAYQKPHIMAALKMYLCHYLQQQKWRGYGETFWLL